MKNYIALVGALVVGIAIGYFIADRMSTGNTKHEEERAVPPVAETRFSERYKFINPLLECDSYVPSDAKLLTSLRAKLVGLVGQLQNGRSVADVSVYYRDLNNGPWIGINEGKSFAPASMLKVPTMMAVLKKSESTPGFLTKTFTVEEQDLDDFQPNIDDRMIQVGSEHTVSSLIESMIVYSDNTAKNVLLRALDVSVDGVDPWKAMGMTPPDRATPDDFLSVKDYSSFFRILFNATYVSRDHSEYALELLSRTNFQDGIRKGVGEGILVSSKFGERGSADSDIKQLHECGIVYDGARPYLLCVMTRGNSWADQALAIQEVARLVQENR